MRQQLAQIGAGWSLRELEQLALAKFFLVLDTAIFV